MTGQARRFDARRLSTFEGSAVEVVGYRNQAPGFAPRSGEGARRFGGRFNPPGSFPVLYLCLTRPCVTAELGRLAARQGLAVADLLPRELWQARVALDRVLDLTDPGVLDTVGLQPADLVLDDHQLTREIGAAAHSHGCEAVRSWSATGVGEVLAVFVERADDEALRLDLVEVWHEPADLSRSPGAEPTDGGGAGHR